MLLAQPAPDRLNYLYLFTFNPIHFKELHVPCQWIIADVDGCISPEESTAWDFERFAAFAARVRAANRGAATLAPMTLCTGRPQPYVEVLMKLLDVRVPAICENGAVLYTLPDNTARFAPQITQAMLAGLRQLRTFIETQILPAHPRLVMQFGKEAQISIFCEQPEMFPHLKEQIERYLDQSGGPNMHISASHYYLNLSFEGVNKGNAIRSLQTVLNVEKKDLAGIGDTEGDLPLRENVGFFACPSNARPAIKDVADYVSPYPDLQGMLDILNLPQLQWIR